MLFICKKHTVNVYEEIEVDWGVWGRGTCILSHGINRGAGVAVLFAQKEVCKGRLLVVRARIQRLILVCVNVYAHHTGRERAVLFKALWHELPQVKQDDILVLGGDFNCTIEPHLDRRGKEPRVDSAVALREIVTDYDLVATWRVKHPGRTGFTQIKTGPDRVSTARLDRIYISSRPLYVAVSYAHFPRM